MAATIAVSVCIIVFIVILCSHQYRSARDLEAPALPAAAYHGTVVKEETTRSFHATEKPVEQGPTQEASTSHKSSLFLTEPDSSSKKNASALKRFPGDLMEQLRTRIGNPHCKASEIYLIATELLRRGDGGSLSSVLGICRETEEAGVPSIALLRAVGGVRDPALTNVLERHAQIAVEEHHDALLGAISDALAGIGTSESVGVLKDIALSSPPDTDVGLVVSESLSRVTNTEAVPQLAEFITERIPGYEGAMKGLLNMEGRGVYELAELIEYDNRGKLEEDLRSIMDDIVEYDEEVYLAFKELAGQPLNNSAVYLDAMKKLEESRR